MENDVVRDPDELNTTMPLDCTSTFGVSTLKVADVVFAAILLIKIPELEFKIWNPLSLLELSAHVKVMEPVDMAETVRAVAELGNTLTTAADDVVTVEAIVVNALLDCELPNASTRK